jgi:hypothetical protein
VGAGPAEAEASVSSTDNLSTLARMAGIVRRPRPTFEAIVRTPRWMPVLPILFLVSFGASAAFLATGTGRLALVDQWERVAIAFGQDVDEERYAAFHAQSRDPLPYAAWTSAARVTGATVVLGSVLFAVFTGLRRGTARYTQVLAVATYAAVILALRDLVAVPARFVRESTASPVTLATLFTMLDEASLPARFFGLIDLFVVWWLVVLAVGMSALYRRRVAGMAGVLLGTYLAVALVLAGVMAALGGAQ